MVRISKNIRYYICRFENKTCRCCHMPLKGIACVSKYQSGKRDGSNSKNYCARCAYKINLITDSDLNKHNILLEVVP